ncbi:hypothetical protein HY994_01305 [Candidatus Micrarchaeota archaeon]|nr:hypothetical protein [Candidatus Micrarchaeota archaeon]
MAKMSKSKKTAPKKSSSKSKKSLPSGDRRAELQFHRFLDLWNAHIREQINVHRKILQGKQSLKQHLTQTKKIHQKFLKQLGKV